MERKRKKKGMNDGLCKLELDDFNRAMRNDGKYQACTRMLGHMKHAGVFDNEEISDHLKN